MRSAVGFVSRASFAALSAASFPRIPTCPGTHIKKIKKKYVTALEFVLSEDGQFLIFRALVKRIVSLKKKIIIFFFFFSAD